MSSRSSEFPVPLVVATHAVKPSAPRVESSRHEVGLDGGSIIFATARNSRCVRVYLRVDSEVPDRLLSYLGIRKVITVLSL